MIAMNTGSERQFYRDADRAVLGGVCAGLAGYLGFNLKVTRLLAFIAFLMAMPIAVIAYLAAVFLIPSVSRHEYGDAVSRSECRRERRKARKERKAGKRNEAPAEPRSIIVSDINRRCESMDERLARLEKHVTSKRFQIEQELERL